MTLSAGVRRTLLVTQVGAGALLVVTGASFAQVALAELVHPPIWHGRFAFLLVMMVAAAVAAILVGVIVILHGLRRCRA